MTKTYWLAISRSNDVRASTPEKSWWCLRYDTKVGDEILFYRPRSVSSTTNGLFAEYVVTKPPQSQSALNSQCSHFGFGLLGYGEIALQRRFDPSLTAQDIKRDPVLANSNFVRRNFQATTFRLSAGDHKRLMVMLKSRESRKQTLKA